MMKPREFWISNSMRIRRDLLWLAIFSFSRIYAYSLGLRYDGDRVVQDFMQFPSIDQLTPENIWNIANNFHFAPPGLPIIYTVLQYLFGNSWEFVAWISMSTLGFLAGLAVLRIFNDRPMIGWTTVVIFIAINPSIHLFEAQFYSTAITAYVLCILVWEIQCNASSSLSLFRKSIMVGFLAYIRPSFLPILAMLFIILLLVLFLKTSATPERRLVAALVVIGIISPLAWFQSGRVEKFGQFSFASAGVTGTIYSLMGYGEVLGIDYARDNYLPFVNLPDAPKVAVGNPLLDSKYKSSGVANWNSNSNLVDYRLDQKHFVSTLWINRELVVKMMIHSVAWISTNPSCSRVLTEQNYGALKDFDRKYRYIVYLEMGQLAPNENFKVCGKTSGVQITYLMILGAFLLIFPFQFYQKVRQRNLRVFELYSLYLLIYVSLVLSLLNGSHELSKYRIETELPIIIFLLLNTILKIPKVLNFFKNRRRATL
jgi:hypothetical protein